MYNSVLALYASALAFAALTVFASVRHIKDTNVRKFRRAVGIFFSIASLGPLPRILIIDGLLKPGAGQAYQMVTLIPLIGTLFFIVWLIIVKKV